MYTSAATLVGGRASPALGATRVLAVPLGHMPVITVAGFVSASSPRTAPHTRPGSSVYRIACPRSGPAPGGGNGGVEGAVRTLQDATLLQLNKTAKRGYRADADGAHTSTLRARHSRWNLRVETHSVWRGFDMQRGRESVSLGETRSATRAGCPAPRRVFKSGMVHIAVVHTRGEQCVCPGAVLRSVAVPAHPVGFGTAVEAQPLKHTAHPAAPSQSAASSQQHETGCNLTRVGWGTATAGEGVTTPQ
jgi:hypothetical protein